MILLDQRKGSAELLPHLRRLNASAELADLQYGDVCFEGKGPEAAPVLTVGIERKTLHDMLTCIEDGRYNQQRIGMRGMYDISILLVEGHWRPHDPDLFLMEGFNGGVTWGYCKPGGRRQMYASLKRYLISVQLSGVFVDYTRDLSHSAINILEWFHYFQKPWDSHTSMLEVQKFALPALMGKPSLARKWANDLDGVGPKQSEKLARHFKTGIRLANADEIEFVRAGLGVKLAQDVYRQIHGVKR